MTNQPRIQYLPGDLNGELLVPRLKRLLLTRFLQVPNQTS
jgi:hypothetical protein